MTSSDAAPASLLPSARDYQQEMLEHSLRQNIIVAMDTGSGKTLIAVLRIRAFLEKQSSKVAWFLAPTVMLCEQQKDVLDGFVATPVALVSGALEPNSWKDPVLWQHVLKRRVVVSTPQVLLDALHHGYVNMGIHIGLIVFDEAHHVADKHPYNLIMKNFYFTLPLRSLDDNRGDRLERPAILGLTASPTFGGNDIEQAFQTIEENLDSVILAPQVNQEEYAQYAHRPVFKHLLYTAPYYVETGQYPSQNLIALAAVVNTMNIENDPYVQSMRRQLASLELGPQWSRLDQKLSKTVTTESSYTHKGLRDFLRAAEDVCCDLGPWSADWFVEKVVRRAQAAAGPHRSVIDAWNEKEKHYLLTLLAKVRLSSVSFDDAHVVAGVTDKVEALIECLREEKDAADAESEIYSCLVFVQRRDTVLVLSELLQHHPGSRHLFQVGCLLGSSNSQYRRSFLDITRELLKQSQADTLRDFRLGEKTLIISTSVAEEGIDIQACGTVIRWDPPENMVSWAQSRGRARRKKSTFVLMFDQDGADQERILKWQKLEKEMAAQYRRQRYPPAQRPMATDPLWDGEDDVCFRVDSTGAILTAQSAVPHLEHFCAVLPNGKHVPIYDDDPPEYPEGWHLLGGRPGTEPYQGPYGATVTLPRLLPPHLRVFTVERVYPTKVSARQHVASKAYLALYEARLLNDNLLPLTSVLEPDMEEEVKTLLKDVMKRAGTADVALQINPWAPPPDASSDMWHCSELAVTGMPTLYLLTQVRTWTNETFELYTGQAHPLAARLKSVEGFNPDSAMLALARDYTRTLFWSIHGNRMTWDDTDFKYLLLPTSSGPEDAAWEQRRAWWRQSCDERGVFNPATALLAPVDLFVQAFGLPADLAFLADGYKPTATHRFLSWRHERLPEEKEQELEAKLTRFELRVSYPLIHSQALPRRVNFLIPSATTAEPPHAFLLPQHASLVLSPPHEVHYALLLPSIFRFMAMSMTLRSFRETVLANTPLTAIDPSLLLVAITAPVSGEKDNYERLETLGDTALKLIASITLFAEHPFWHEGYLSRRKDHTVSNAQQALRAIDMELFRWIIRDRFVSRKWKPAMRIEKAAIDVTTPTAATPNGKRSETRKKTQQLSTKLLADVVEACIGAAMLTGGWDLAVDCVKLFGLGISDWRSVPASVQMVLERTETLVDFPSQTTDVERIIGYTFERKAFLVEAITHSSSQAPYRTTSYERMEFLGDAVLDWIVTERLYKAEGKNYSPGHMHLRKQAIVNAHFLAFICLRAFVTTDTTMPHWDELQGVTLVEQEERIHLFQCMLHSSRLVLDDQEFSFARFQKLQELIEKALDESTTFPWEQLVRLQAPKFLCDIVESLIGAVWLDSEGNFEVVFGMLERLGIIGVLDRIVSQDVDVQHPVSRLGLWASKRFKKIRYSYEQARGKVICSVVVHTFDKDGKEEIAEPVTEARVTTRSRGRRAEMEARFAAAELAIKRMSVQTMDEMIAQELEVDLDLDSDDDDEEDGMVEDTP